jgi:hypothetical protein
MDMAAAKGITAVLIRIDNSPQGGFRRAPDEKPNRAAVLPPREFVTE